MKCQVSINGKKSLFKITSVVVQQTLLGMPAASIVMKPDLHDPLTKEEIRDFLGAPVQISWSSNKEKNEEKCTFNGFVDELLPSVTEVGQFIQLNVLTNSEILKTSPFLRIFTDKSLADIVATIANANGQSITFLGDNPKVYFSIQQYEDDISYLSRLAEEHGKIFFNNGLELYCMDWVSKEQAIPVNYSNVSHLSMALNTLPSNLELKGRLSDAKEPKIINTEIDSPSVEPLKSVFDRSNQIYPKARMHLSHLLDEANVAKYYPALMRRQVREMVRINASTEDGRLCAGSVITFNKISIIDQGQRFRIAEIQHSFGTGDTYSNTFIALPDDPLATPESTHIALPSDLLTIRAIVTNVQDEKKLGRVKVRFPEADYSDESPFLPIVCPFTGNGGAFFYPEEGDEVLVMATNGALERSPVIIGAFYSSKNTAENWQKGRENRRGFQSGEVGVFAENNGRLIIQANEIFIMANKQMEIEVGGELTQKATIIQLNP